MGCAEMKKASGILILFLSFILVFSFTACQETASQQVQVLQSAAELWDKIDQTMNGLESMEMTSMTRFSYYESGNLYYRTVSRKLLSAKDAHYTQSTDTTHCPALSFERSFSTMEAYFAGKVYTAVTSGMYAQKFCTEMTHEEYDHAPASDLLEDFQITACANAEFSKDENGLWNLKFSGYEKTVIDNVLQSMGLPAGIFGANITDMAVTLTANADYYVQNMQITLSFAEGENKPQFSIAAEYTGFNSTQFDPTMLNPQEFTTVDDIRILTALTDALQQRQNAANGQFTLGMTNTYDCMGQVSVSTETDIVEYVSRDGWYSYSIASDMDGSKYQIDYQNGLQTVTVGESSYTTEQTDAQAKAFIDSLIDSARYNSAAVTAIQKLEDGSYVLICEKLDIQEYAADYETEQLKLTNGTQNITVSFENGVLSQIKSVLTLMGTYNDEPMMMVADTQVTFQKT